jgi:rhodanese-related sulfurtransferase
VSARETIPPQAAVEQILGHAAERAQRMGLRYAGAVTPGEAQRLSEAGAAVIVDVRTEPEYRQVGHVPGTPRIEWPRGGERSELARFAESIRSSFEPSQKILFLCRSGVRSHYAAELMAHMGHDGAYNVLEGFEGDYGAGTNGWRAAGLPWQTG